MTCAPRPRLTLAAALLLALLTFCCSVYGQQPASSVVVPRLVNFSGKAAAGGKTISGIAGVTFAIYQEESGGSPLWIETQNVQADAKGNYTAQLGATKPEGLPLDLFTSGAARWLGVTVNGGEEQPRILLLSVPYALKAADAQTLGGLPASAFMLAGPAVAVNGSSSAAASTADVSTAAVSGTGTTDFVPLWTNSTGALGNSVLFQAGTGTTAKVGINTTTPGATLDVNGGENVHGILNLPEVGAATAAAGKNSQPQDFIASAFNSSSSTAVSQKFQWQAEPVGNNTAAASGVMSLLFTSGSGAPAETGLKISGKGVLTFAAGQTFPGTGKGTVTSVGLSAPASDFTVSGTPVTTAGTLALKWNIAPTPNDTPNAIVKRDGTGAFAAGAITATASGAFGVSGTSDDSVGVGGTSTTSYGGQFTSVSSLGAFAQSLSGPGFEADSSSNEGIIAFSGTTAAILGIAQGTQSTSSGFGPDGVVGEAGAGVGTGVVAINTNASGDAFLAINQGSSTGPAALFVGSVDVDGNLSKSGGSFKIDHPLDPANKYLYHSFVESPDMMNIYNGDATLDEKGEATVQLPDWFESLNQDFRYQLTAVGAPGPNLYIAEKVHGNSFRIAGGRPGAEVSWQITGIRHDAWANAHRIPVEIAKPAAERGSYIHPELFGAPATKSVAAVHHPMINHLATTKITGAKPAQK